MFETIKTPSAIAVLREALRRALYRADPIDVYGLLDEASRELNAPARAQIAAGNVVDQVAERCLGDVCGLIALAIIVEEAHRRDLDSWLASRHGRPDPRIAAPLRAA